MIILYVKQSINVYSSFENVADKQWVLYSISCYINNLVRAVNQTCHSTMQNDFNASDILS